MKIILNWGKAMLAYEIYGHENLLTSILHILGNVELSNLILDFLNFKINANKIIEVPTIGLMGEKFYKTTFLLFCIYKEKFEFFKLFLKIPKINVNLEHSEMNPLMSACVANDVKSIDLILAHPGVDVNYQNVRYNWTSLMLAAYFDAVDALKILLKIEFLNINLKDYRDLTVFDWCMTEETAKILHEYQSNKKKKTN